MMISYLFTWQRYSNVGLWQDYLVVNGEIRLYSFLYNLNRIINNFLPFIFVSHTIRIFSQKLLTNETIYSCRISSLLYYNCMQ